LEEREGIGSWTKINTPRIIHIKNKGTCHGRNSERIRRNPDANSPANPTD
jgi:hypothetical protein